MSNQFSIKQNQKNLYILMLYTYEYLIRRIRPLTVPLKLIIAHTFFSVSSFKRAELHTFLLVPLKEKVVTIFRNPVEYL